MTDPAHTHTPAAAEDQVMPAITYALFLLGLVTGGVTSIVGLIIAYSQRESAGWRNRSHYDFLIRPEELADFTECFVVGTAAEVTPVAEIGEYTFTPGNISLSLMDDYAKMVRRELQPA